MPKVVETDNRPVAMTTKILVTILGLILAGVILWYNTSVYYAYETGKLTSEWYLIFLLIPLIQLLIINYLYYKKSY